LIHT